MTQATDLQALVMAVGEVKGQMRELVHATNNNTQASNHMASSIAKLETIPADIAELKTRITALEVSENKRAGAMGLGGWLIGLMSGGIGAAIVALIELLRGRHP